MCNNKNIIGKAYLWSEEKEPRIGEIQICVRLQDKRIKETDGTTREWDQRDEGTN